MQKRSIVNSPGVQELKRKKHQVLKTKIILYSIFFVLFVLGISFSFRINKFIINEIRVSGNIVVDTKSIEDVVRSDMNGYYAWIFPKTNFVIYPKNKILRDLSQKYKRLKNISLNVVNFKTLEISVKEYDGKYLWCGNVVPELDNQTEQNCYFMDSNGYIFDKAPFFSGEIYLKFYGSISNGEDPSGNYYNPLVFAKLITLKENLEKTNLKPSYIWINSQNEVSIGLSKLGIASVNPLILFKLDSDYEKIAENLQAAITTEPLQKKLKENYGSLLYMI